MNPTTVQHTSRPSNLRQSALPNNTVPREQRGTLDASERPVPASTSSQPSSSKLRAPAEMNVSRNVRCQSRTEKIAAPNEFPIKRAANDTAPQMNVLDELLQRNDDRYFERESRIHSVFRSSIRMGIEDSKRTFSSDYVRGYRAGEHARFITVPATFALCLYYGIPYANQIANGTPAKIRRLNWQAQETFNRELAAFKEKNNTLPIACRAYRMGLFPEHDYTPLGNPAPSRIERFFEFFTEGPEHPNPTLYPPDPVYPKNPCEEWTDLVNHGAPQPPRIFDPEQSRILDRNFAYIGVFLGACAAARISAAATPHICGLMSQAMALPFRLIDHTSNALAAQYLDRSRSLVVEDVLTLARRVESRELDPAEFRSERALLGTKMSLKCSDNNFFSSLLFDLDALAERKFRAQVSTPKGSRATSVDPKPTREILMVNLRQNLDEKLFYLLFAEF